MTKIENIFTKDINRDIRGVIKIGEDDQKIKQQELDEYVVTNELKQDFTRFFDAYNHSINNSTDAMGVWISGFFGSGKSHFLKILAYLLENAEFDNNRKAIDYFLEDGKFEDDHLANAINTATSVPTDVALFNIDSKASSNAAGDSNAILNVFLKVFNEQLGYSSIPVVADMERWLDSINKYDAFQAAFASSYDSDSNITWKSSRNKYALLSTKIREALIDSGALNEEDARNYVDNHLQSGKYSISAEEFASLVKNYLDQKGNDHHFIFLADEVGQFIGDDDKRMLNLQTIVEQLGVQCQGRAWVVVTSQQQMDEVTESFSRHKRDFSKIQGRFNTLINMSSANADEVIKKRLLDKKPLAAQQLEDLFTQNEYSINNKISFSDSINRQSFTSAQEFAENYPFIPYQFSLLKDVLAAVRKRGANGSHMSDGERSMLATFQEATIRYKNSDIGKLVPFAAFFIGMKEFLSHDHQVVFDKAVGDSYINPNHDDYCFNVQVLAVLFMVKYVDNYPSTLENITTLLLDDINEDRMALTAKVKDALHVLQRQNYIQQNLDTYEFLTDSEQEVNESINAIEVDDRNVIKRIGNYLLGDNLIQPKYKYPNMGNKYIFEFNMYIDGAPLNRGGHQLDIRVVSPLQAKEYDELNFRQNSNDGKSITIVLKDDDRYIENYRRIEKVTEYLNSPESRSDEKKRSIAYRRQEESREIADTTEKMLKDDLIDADIYVLGDVLPKGTNFATRFEKAKKELIDNNYRYLNYLESVKDESDIVNIFKNPQDLSLVKENSRAITEIINYITLQTNGMNNVSLNGVINHFKDIPYGYREIDVAWVVARAFADGKLRLYFNNEQLTLGDAQEHPKDFSKYFINRNNTSKLTLKPVKELTSKQKKDAADFVDVVLDSRLVINKNDTSEQVAADIKHQIQSFIKKLELMASQKYRVDINYPNHDLLMKGIKALKRLIDVRDNDQIFQHISRYLDDLEDWRDDVDDTATLEFYKQNSEQQRIWNRSRDYLTRYNTASGFIRDSELINIADKLKQNLDDRNFNKSIPALSNLNNQFATKYNDAIEKLYTDIKQRISAEKDIVMQRVDEVQFPADIEKQFTSKIDQDFDTILTQAKSFSESSAPNAYVSLYSLKGRIDSTRQTLQNEISRKSEELVAQERQKQEVVQAEVKPSSSEKETETTPPTKVTPVPTRVVKTKSVKIADLVADSSWHITDKSDIDNYIEVLKKKLEEEYQDLDILNVDFK